MAAFPNRLEHHDIAKKDDATLKQEAQLHFAKSAPLQVIAEMLDKLRKLSLPWWTPESLRSSINTTTRMMWFTQRADLRQQVTTSITGLLPNLARRKPAEFQAALIDCALDEAGVSCATFEQAFEPQDLAVYGDAGAYWKLFRERMPWRENTPVHQELVGSLLKLLLANRSAIDGFTRRPILTPWDVRTAINHTIWHTRLPLEVRVAIDEQRFQHEKNHPKEPFVASHDLSIATPDVIVAHIPLKELEAIFDAAEKHMGLAREAASTEVQPASVAPVPPPAASTTKLRSVPSPPESTKAEGSKNGARTKSPDETDELLIRFDDEPLTPEDETGRFETG